MILELAKQSIQTKIKLKSATMLGNYEFYYGAGILCRELEISIAEEIQPGELYKTIRSHTDGQEFDNPQVAHLVKMIYYYMPEEIYDSQMAELLRLGRTGE